MNEWEAAISGTVNLSGWRKPVGNAQKLGNHDNFIWRTNARKVNRFTADNAERRWHALDLLVPKRLRNRSTEFLKCIKLMSSKDNQKI